MAITEFEGALAADPAQHLLLLYLARASAQAGKHAKAIEAFGAFSKRLEELSEDEFLGQAYVEMAGSYLAHGEATRAAETYAAALARNPQDANALVGLAKVALARGDHDQAARELHKAIAIRPRSAIVLEALAELHGERNEWEEAVSVLQRATVRIPRQSHSSTRNWVARFERRVVTKMPFRFFKGRPTRFPQQRSQFCWLEGRVLGRLGRWGEAAHLFRRALEDVPWKLESPGRLWLTRVIESVSCRKRSTSSTTLLLMLPKVKGPTFVGSGPTSARNSAWVSRGCSFSRWARWPLGYPQRSGGNPD